MQAIIDRLEILGSDAALAQIIIWLSAASVFVLCLGGAFIALNFVDPLRRRVGNLGDRSVKSNESDWLISLGNAIGPFGAFVLPSDELERNKMMAKFHHAGFKTKTALQTFYVIKTVLILVCPLVVIVSSRFMPEASTGDILLYAMIAAGLGMLAPNMVLDNLVKKRMRKISNAFPDALDLLVVCVESGLGLSSALERVAGELEVSHPELAGELATVNSEIRVGVTREQAMKNLAERTGLEDIRGLVGLLVQTMRFGTGVADALRVYSEEFRDKRTQKAEEQAAKMATKIIFPLVLCMFPVFFIVAIGPAVIRIIDAFSMM